MPSGHVMHVTWTGVSLSLSLEHGRTPWNPVALWRPVYGVCETLRWAPARGEPSRGAWLLYEETPSSQLFLGRGTRPPRLVAHGVPAERLASPAGKGGDAPYGVCKPLRWPSLGESHWRGAWLLYEESLAAIFLGRGTRPPRLVAHGVPAERLASPAGKGVVPRYGVCKPLRWAPARGEPSAWCLAPLRGDPPS
ncbi:hypothetical protein CAAN4_C07250 [[Candida] anglica]|uniref:Uncharacterized protein n=1 Tax=[Candida] anglica TaxID=148631 RepID=A0ABP0E962_9ASCO